MSAPDRAHRALAGEFLVRLGSDMALAGESVDRIRARMMAVARVFDLGEIEIAVFPTLMLIETGHGVSAQVHLSSQTGMSLRLDQVAALYDVLKDAEEDRITPADGIERLDAIHRMRARVPWFVRVLGHGLAAAGLSLLFHPSVEGLLASAGLGMVVGLFKLPHRPSHELVYPVLSSFVVALVVLALFDDLDDPLGTLIPPLITLLPGGALTTGTVEVATGQMISGAGRLAYGTMQLMLLAFGILAAAALLEKGPGRLVYTAESGYGWWVSWLGVGLLALGYYLHYSAPSRALPYLAGVLLVAHLGQVVGAAVFDSQLSGFFGALALTPVVLWLDATNHGPPSLVTFLPGFWLLVPGAGGVVGLTELVGSHQRLGLESLASVLITIMSIALGVLIGTALYRSLATSVQVVSTAVPIPRWFDVPVPRGDLAPRYPRRFRRPPP